MFRLSTEKFRHSFDEALGNEFLKLLLIDIVMFFGVKQNAKFSIYTANCLTFGRQNKLRLLSVAMVYLYTYCDCN